MGAWPSRGSGGVPLFAVIDTGALGDQTLIAAVANKSIRLLALKMMSAAAVLVQFKSNPGGNVLSGAFSLPINGDLTMPFSPVGWLQTAVGHSLEMNLSLGIAIDGVLVYTLV